MKFTYKIKKVLGLSKYPYYLEIVDSEYEQFSYVNDYSTLCNLLNVNNDLLKDYVKSINGVILDNDNVLYFKTKKDIYKFFKNLHAILVIKKLSNEGVF